MPKKLSWLNKYGTINLKNEASVDSGQNWRGIKKAMFRTKRPQEERPKFVNKREDQNIDTKGQ